MKRHAGLLPLSHDHHQGLVHASRMTKAAEGERPMEAAADDFLAFFPVELSRHFQEEEEVLCPLLVERCGADDPQLVRLLDEHRRLNALAGELREARGSGGDLKPPLAALGFLLERHIRFEERELFPRIEEMLSEEELLALPAHFTGGPSCATSKPAGKGDGSVSGAS